jgi:hypothetical protein
MTAFPSQCGQVTITMFDPIIYIVYYLVPAATRTFLTLAIYGSITLFSYKNIVNMSKVCTGKDNKIIISFSGQGNGMGTLPQFEFVNFLEKYYNNYERHFYLDKNSIWYHRGIDGISTNIDETLSYLKKIISQFEEVILIGSSAGGYAAILFGSLLHVTKVIAFKPQTYLTHRTDIDKKYANLSQYINSTTRYYIYGDVTIDKMKDHLHHISHCENINSYPNVIVNTDYEIDLRKLRDAGILQAIMHKCIK